MRVAVPRPAFLVACTLLVSIAAFLAALAFAPPAEATQVAAGGIGWLGDFFDGNASGQAVFEDMAIHPQSVRVGSTVYVVYQGFGLDPYIVAFSDDGRLDGPYRIGPNPLVWGSDPDDSHGAPSISADPGRNRLHVFWGSHGSVMMHGQASMSDISKWEFLAEGLGAVTYPQIFTDSSGLTRLFYRCNDSSVTPSYVIPRYSWWEAVSVDGGSTWATATPVLLADAKRTLYVHFQEAAGGLVHMVVATHDAANASPLGRSGVYYAVRDETTAQWKDVQGTPLASPGRPISLAELTSLSYRCVVPASGANQNSVTAADDGTGKAGLLFVSGAEAGPDGLAWMFARWDGSKWAISQIARTDFLMDSGTLEYTPDGLDAYLTVGGDIGYVPTDPYDYRGGDIVQYHSADGGKTWSAVRVLATADPSRGIMYNDPQIVVGHDSSGPRVLFGEWDNDTGLMVHKVFLWGPGGFRKREFFTGVKRLAGATRYETAVAISKEGFPIGGDTVVVASGEVFADGLTAGPLAAAYHAPLLLMKRNSVPSSVAAEIRRLRARTVIVVGGPGTVTAAATKGLRVGRVVTVNRLYGADRYETAEAVALQLQTLKPLTHTAFIASGKAFADALSASSLAAARGMPVLLTRPGEVPIETVEALAALEVSRTIVVGGPATVSDKVLAELPSATRIWGPDRYSTASAVAVLALDGRPGLLAPSAQTDRIVIASGSVFPDALAGAPLAARVHAPLLLTLRDALPETTADLLGKRARNVLNCFVLGGTGTVRPSAEAELSSLLVPVPIP